MEPLTLIDAKHGATVERWINQWQAQFPHDPHYFMVPLPPFTTLQGLGIGYSTDGAWYTETLTDDGQHVHTTWHATREALISYVVAWARGSK